MTYCCDSCGFLFFRTGEIKSCPSCDGYRIRPATAEEAVQLQHLLSGKTKKTQKLFEIPGTSQSPESLARQRLRR